MRNKMFSNLISQDDEDEDDFNLYEDSAEQLSRFCRHGYTHANCQECENEDDCDIDKCLNCGRYRASSSLNSNQCCIKGCRNPAED